MSAPTTDAPETSTWTGRLRGAAVRTFPPDRLLPDTQPVFVSSWIYVFGVLSIASLIVIILSGSILTLKGPSWWHFTGVGHFFNSIHPVSYTHLTLPTTPYV